tara:strand:- start:189 stop:371 length:183 start_codon:yes stop_codon:yes gene_type:complete
MSLFRLLTLVVLILTAGAVEDYFSSYTASIVDGVSFFVPVQYCAVFFPKPVADTSKGLTR